MKWGFVVFGRKGGGRFEKGETMTSVCSMMSSPYPKLIAYVFVVGSIGSVI